MGTVLGPFDFKTAGDLKKDVTHMRQHPEFGYDPEIIQRHSELYQKYITTVAR